MTIRRLFIAALALFLSGMYACKKEGCTDFSAANHDPSATEDDGSCRYEGCTDPEAWNYDLDAETDDGSCLYLSDVFFYVLPEVESNHAFSVYWNGAYSGRVRLRCASPDIDCGSTSCESVVIREVEPGSYNYMVVYGQLGGAGSFVPEDTVEAASVRVGSSQCRSVFVE